MNSRTTSTFRGMPKVDPTFDGRLKKAYEAAMAKDLWKGKYAGQSS